MSGTTISAESGSRLASFIEARRPSLVACIVGSTVLQRPRSIAANAFTHGFLERLTREIASVDLLVLEPWVRTARDLDRVEHARLVANAFRTIAAQYASHYGVTDDVVDYLKSRAGELAVALQPEPEIVSPLLDPITSGERDRFVASLLAAIETRDPATCEHSRAVGLWSARMAKQLGMTASQQAEALFAGTLHDVGKIATPSDVLLKAGPLDDDEWETMRAHSRIGAKMLERIPALRELAPIVRAHHERVDGRGYPDRLAGDGIPLVARIVSVADSFHAMISRRPYREAMPVAKALDELRRGRGTQWDEATIDSMLGIVAPAGIPRALGIARSTG